MTTQTPTWREEPTAGRPSGERATAGTLVGNRYELRAPIGNGGMGTVWRATDSLLRRDVAVKEVILPPTMPPNERNALCERTLREARAAAALSHPSVVQVYDVVTDGGRPWIVMELLEARSLADMVIEDGPLNPRAVAKIGIAMLGALEVAHAAGVLHRDVKPANVLICVDGRCVLTDFGVARLPTESKLTTPGMVLGSPHFISPERAVGGSFGPPSDLFSLGVTLYTAVEGGPPFDRGDPFETMRAVVEEPPRPARLAGPLQPVLWGLLDKEPSRRWNVEHARTALRELLAGPLAPAGAAHARHDTDPHAVVRPPPGPPPAVFNGAQVGGRALLDPHEPLSGQIARLRGGEPGTRELRGGEPGTRELRGGEPGNRELRGSELRGGEPSTRDFGARQPPPRRTGEWSPAPPRREGPGRRRAPSAMSVLSARVRTLGQEGPSSYGRMMVLVGAGLAVLMALVLIGLGAGWFSPSDGAGPPPAATPSAASANPPAAGGPLIPVQEYRERGIAVNVPKDWERSGSGSYVDYVDPAGARKVRINIESTSATATKFLQSAESGLKNPSRCPSPYQQVALGEAELAATPAAELEYTCGTGEAKRHGIWRVVVVNGKAYHFYLTVPDADFAESRVIYDEMVRSFTFTT